ncbi:MAG TPA: YdeI/OmpD-associated family protein [Bacteroidales bacterium]|nr:YdeI/OmpD-associated family protein [Bacteroidales bacterium]
MAYQEFEALLIKPETVGTWTFFIIPFNVEEVFGQKNHVKVKGRINGIEFRSSLTPRGDGNHYMVVSKTLQEAAGITRGDVIHVVMEPDTEERLVDIPEVIQNVFKENEEAGKIFEKLSYTRRKDFVDYIMEAKKDATRDKRIFQMLEEIEKLRRKRKYIS